MSYGHESLCKLHTAYIVNYPGRFGTKGWCFYKLENYIADLCIGKPHYFWTQPREKELWLALQSARLEATIKPVSNPLRFFDKHGNACFVVPTNDGPCQVDSKVYCNPKYDIMRGNSTNGSNQGNTVHLAHIESATAQNATD